MSSQNGPIVWRNDEPLERVAELTDELYYSMQEKFLCDFPEPLEQRCWAGLRQQGQTSACAQTLFNVWRARAETSRSLADVRPLKRLLDALEIEGTGFERKIGRAILDTVAVRELVQAAYAAEGICEDDLFDAPPAVVERLWPVESAAANEQSLAGFVLAGVRGLLVEVASMRLFSIVLAVAEADRMWRASDASLGDSAARWALDRLDVVEAGLDEAQAAYLGRLLLGAAIVARDTNCHLVSLALSERARRLLPDGSNELAECLCLEGMEYERQGNLYTASERYEAGLTCQPTDEVLRATLQLNLGTLRNTLEGNLSAPLVDAGGQTKLGFDPEFLPVLERILKSLAAGQNSSDEELLSAINVLQGFLDQRLTAGAPADELLQLYCQMLMMGLSLADPTQTPFRFGELIDAADRLALSAQPSNSLPYEQVRTEVKGRIDLLMADLNQMQSQPSLDEMIAQRMQGLKSSKS